MNEQSISALHPRRKSLASTVIALLLIVGLSASCDLAQRGGQVNDRERITQLENEYAADPDDLDTAVELALAYVRAGRALRLMEQAMAPLDGMAEFMDDPEFDARLAELGGMHEGLMRERGFESREDYMRALQRGLAHTGEVLDQAGLTNDQRVTLLLVRSDLFTLTDNPAAGAEAAREAIALNDAFPGAHLLLSDALVELEDYAAAGAAAQQAMDRIDGWMDRPPDLQSRLMFTLSDSMRDRPYGHSRRQWERDRQAAAQQWREMIQTQIELTEALDRAHSMEFN